MIVTVSAKNLDGQMGNAQSGARLHLRLERLRYNWFQINWLYSHTWTVMMKNFRLLLLIRLQREKLKPVFSWLLDGELECYMVHRKLCNDVYLKKSYELLTLTSFSILTGGACHVTSTMSQRFYLRFSGLFQLFSITYACPYSDCDTWKVQWGLS